MFLAQHWSTQCPGSISTKPISTSPPLQSIPGFGHRVRKTQPEGGLIGLGISPLINIFSLSFPFTFGTADKSARV